MKKPTSTTSKTGFPPLRNGKHPHQSKGRLEGMTGRFIYTNSKSNNHGSNDNSVLPTNKGSALSTLGLDIQITKKEIVP